TTDDNGDSADVQYGPTFADVIPLLPVLTGKISGAKALAGDLPAHPKVAFTTTGAFGHFGSNSELTFAQSGTDLGTMAAALLFTGSGTAVDNYERAFNSVTG